MPYGVLPLDQLPKRRSERPLASVTKYKKHGIAKATTRPKVDLTIKQKQCNDMAYLRYSESLQDFLISNFWFWRGKIEDPTTPTSQKKVYQKMCKVYESYFSLEWLKRTGYCTRTKRATTLGHAHKFCYVPGRVQ